MFKRVGDNLYINMDITLQEALLGFEKTITHLDGHQVTIRSSPNVVVQPFSWKVIPGEGMPIRNSGEYGELHVKMLVSLPKKLTPQ